MRADVIKLMYGYNTWANERVLARVAELTPEQYTASGSASYSSVRDTLVHTMWGQAHWLSRWQGQGDAPDYDPNDYTDLNSLRTRWREIDDETHAFIARLDDATLNHLVHYRIRGEAYAYPLWQLMLHQVNHATQHRSEVAVILTGYGHSPGSMDMVVYLQNPSV
ncbi:MAG: DinB family protein [Chloroflexota bacterium]|nr:DinB family protein [Chloroflexota bacterium]